jgi:hypothetical protein
MRTKKPQPVEIVHAAAMRALAHPLKRALMDGDRHGGAGCPAPGRLCPNYVGRRNIVRYWDGDIP